LLDGIFCRCGGATGNERASEMACSVRTSTAAAMAAVLVAAAGAGADIIHENAGPLTVDYADNAVASGAGNVNNAALGANRTLIVTFDVEVTDDGAGSASEGWFAIGFGFDGNDTSIADRSADVVGFDNAASAADEQSEFALLLRTFSDASQNHTAWEDGNNAGRAFGSDMGGSSSDPPGIDGKVRIRVNLSPAGVLAGESATATYEVDVDCDGTYDDIFVDTVDWADSTNYIWFGSRHETEHEATNLLIEAVPEPGALILCGVGGLAMLLRRRSSTRRQPALRRSDPKAL
jgi:hypothetical protein